MPLTTVPYVYEPQTIQDPQDIGNNFPSGLCVGPNTVNDPSFPGAKEGVTLESALAYGYGNGLLMGPQCVYRINPAPPAPDDINGGLAFASGLLNQYIPFQLSITSPRGCQLMKYPSKNIMQFDYPRSFSVTLDVDDTTVTNESYVVVTGRGIDVWGRKMTSSATATITSLTTTGTITVQSDACFFQLFSLQITDILVGTVGATPTVTLGTGNNFGLPYKLTDLGHVYNYSQWNETLSPAAERGEYSNTSIPVYVDAINTYQPYQLAFPQVIEPGWSVNNFNLYTDTRGFFSPQQLFKYSNTNPPVLEAGDSFQYGGPITISYYVPGADVFPWKYQQMMNQLQQSALAQGAVSTNGWNGFGQTLYGQYNDDTHNDCEPTLAMLIGNVPYSDF